MPCPPTSPLSLRHPICRRRPQSQYRKNRKSRPPIGFLRGFRLTVSCKCASNVVKRAQPNAPILVENTTTVAGYVRNPGLYPDDNLTVGPAKAVRKQRSAHAAPAGTKPPTANCSI